MRRRGWEAASPWACSEGAMTRLRAPLMLQVCSPSLSLWAVTTASLAAWLSGSTPDWRTRTSSSPASPSGVRKQSLLSAERVTVMVTPSTAAVQAPVSTVTVTVRLLPCTAGPSSPRRCGGPRN